MLFVEQNLIKSTIDERTEEKRKKEHQAIKLRQQQLQQWVLFGKLSENLQNIIKEYQQYSCKQTGVGDVENLFINLSKDVENNIKRELCLELIKKSEFSNSHIFKISLTCLLAYGNFK